MTRAPVSSGGFTPGPWFADFGEGFCIRDTDKCAVAWTTFVHLKGRRDSEEVTANAHLIAAAPDLLEAVEALFSAVEGYIPADEARAKARSALHKARGEVA